MCSHRCSKCRRPLHTKESIERGMGERCADKARATLNANASAPTTGQPSPTVTVPETGHPPLTQHWVRGIRRDEHRKRIEASMIALADRQTLLPWGQPSVAQVRKKKGSKRRA
jgi:hypothetical protein